MLKIHNVRIENFCQHESLDLDFSGGLTIVLGPNGSGKSNLLNAIYSTFTGSFDRGPGDIRECIRKNSSGPCYTQVSGSLDGREFRLKRELGVTTDGSGGKTEHGLWLDGASQKTYKTAREIETWLAEVSGLTPPMMSEFLFIGQEDLFGFVKRSPSERSKKFSALCGTKPYEQISKKFSTLLNEDRAHFDAAKHKITFLEDAAERALADFHRCEQTLRELASEDETPDVCDALTESEKRLSEITDKKQAFDEREILLQRYDAELCSVQTRLENNSRLCEQSRLALSELTEEADILSKRENVLCEEMTLLLGEHSYEDAVALLDERMKNNERRKILEKKISEANTRMESLKLPKKPEKDIFWQRGESCFGDTDPTCAISQSAFKAQYLNLRNECDNVVRRKGMIESHLESIENFISVLDHLKTPENLDQACECPLCGAEPVHWKTDLNRLASDREEMHKNIQQLETQRQSLEKAMREYEERQKQYETIMHERAALSAWSERFGKEFAECDAYDPDAEEKRHHITNTARQMQDVKLNAQSVRERIRRENELFGQRQLENTALKEELARVQTELDALDAGDAETRKRESEELEKTISFLQQKIHSLRDREKRIAEVTGSLRETQRQYEALTVELKELRRLRDDDGTLPLWFEKCDRALNWLKMDGLPRLIHRSVLGEIVDVVNGELALFNDPFRVRVNDDVSFTALFASGGEMKSKALSGGEKYMLGIAFLSALSRTFAQNLGIMFIDEPTASLDAENILLLFRILEQWKKTLHHRNQQLVIVTHVEEMAAIGDTVIRLGA